MATLYIKNMTKAEEHHTKFQNFKKTQSNQGSSILNTCSLACKHGFVALYLDGRCWKHTKLYENSKPYTIPWAIHFQTIYRLHTRFFLHGRQYVEACDGLSCSGAQPWCLPTDKNLWNSLQFWIAFVSSYPFSEHFRLDVINMDGLSGASGVFAVVSVGIQLGESINKLWVFYHSLTWWD